MRTTLLLSLTLPLALFASPANADEADETLTCSLYDEVSNTQLLRRLSLDLRQRVPSYDEYDALGAAAADEATIEGFVEGPDFEAFVRRFHEDLLWTNVANVRISSNDTQIASIQIAGGTRVMVSASAGRRARWRGDADLFCADYPQTEMCSQADFDNGVSGCDVGPGVPRKNADGQDGWVEVSPYWDPPSCTANDECESRQCQAGSCAPSKVCAFEAQANSEWLPPGVADPTDGLPYEGCNFLASTSLPGCGCGPELRYCFGGSAEATIRGQLREQMMQLVLDHTVEGAPYSGMLTAKRTYMNGPLYMWKKHLAQMTSLSQTFNFWFPGDAPMHPDPDFSDRDWQAHDRGGAHSGILTLPAFSLRFQTNRGRANRFRNVFMGKFFEPPASADQPGCIEGTDDLTKRCYCMGCHQELEQLAAHFGNIAEAGSALLDDRAFFPEQLPCGVPGQGGLVDVLCNRFYVNDPGAVGFGKLLPLQFTDDDSEEAKVIYDNFAAGPAGLAERVIEDGTFARTVVLNLWQQLMHREMDLSPLSADNESALLDELAAELASHDDFKRIVIRMVQLDAYRRNR
jgi:hypothetical protein